MSRLALVLTVAVALGASHAVAVADVAKDKALSLFETSDRAYKAGRFEEAARLLSEAYALYPEPLLLYNLGRAQEGLGDLRAAVASYARYLRDGRGIVDRGAIERRIATLEAQLEARDAEARTLAASEAARQRAEAERSRIERARLADDRSPVERHGPWIAVGAGTLVVAAGALYGFRATSAHDDAVAAPVQRDARTLQDSAERSATIASALLVAGGLVAAGGVGWKIWQWRTRSAAAHVTATPGGLALRGAW